MSVLWLSHFVTHDIQLGYPELKCDLLDLLSAIRWSWSRGTTQSQPRPSLKVWASSLRAMRRLMTSLRDWTSLWAKLTPGGWVCVCVCEREGLGCVPKCQKVTFFWWQHLCLRMWAVMCLQDVWACKGVCVLKNSWTFLEIRWIECQRKRSVTKLKSAHWICCKRGKKGETDNLANPLIRAF